MTTGLSRDTLVRLGDGSGELRRLDKLQVGDILLDAEERNLRVLAVSLPQPGKMKSIFYKEFNRAHETSICCTPNHPIAFTPEKFTPQRQADKQLRWLSRCRRDNTDEQMANLCLEEIANMLVTDLRTTQHDQESISPDDFVDDLVAYHVLDDAQEETARFEKYRPIIDRYLTYQYDDVFREQENLAGTLMAQLSMAPWNIGRTASWNIGRMASSSHPSDIEGSLGDSSDDS